MPHYDRILYSYVEHSMQGYMDSIFVFVSAGGTVEEDIRYFFLIFLHLHICCYEGSFWCERLKVITVIINGTSDSLWGGRARRPVEDTIAEFESKLMVFDFNPDFVAARTAVDMTMGWGATANVTYLTEL